MNKQKSPWEDVAQEAVAPAVREDYGGHHHCSSLPSLALETEVIHFEQAAPFWSKQWVIRLYLALGDSKF